MRPRRRGPRKVNSFMIPDGCIVRVKAIRKRIVVLIENLS